MHHWVRNGLKVKISWSKVKILQYKVKILRWGPSLKWRATWRTLIGCWLHHTWISATAMGQTLGHAWQCIRPLLGLILATLALFFQNESNGGITYSKLDHLDRLQCHNRFEIFGSIWLIFMAFSSKLCHLRRLYDAPKVPWHMGWDEWW